MAPGSIVVAGTAMLLYSTAQGTRLLCLVPFLDTVRSDEIGACRIPEKPPGTGLFALQLQNLGILGDVGISYPPLIASLINVAKLSNLNVVTLASDATQMQLCVRHCALTKMDTASRALGK